MTNLSHKNLSWQGLLSGLFFVIGALQGIAFLLILLRFKILRPQSLILSMIFIGLGIALHKASQNPKTK